ncbi:MAG: SPFH domain-containing protein [Clostridia bacterium]
MGLIQSAVDLVTGVISDQWKEYFICDAMPTNALMVKGIKRTSDKSFNNGNDEIISNGSAISVADGQCMIIVENGKVVEICSEPGAYIYDKSSEPSIFCGNLGESIVETFKILGKRFTFGGDTGNDQRVYYINLKEILGNKYGTVNPVPFRVVDQNIGLDIDISIRCNGEFSYKIVNPMLFYVNVCGNTTGTYDRSNIDSMLKSELLTALQPAFAQISAKGVRYSALAGHTNEIADALNEILSSKWKGIRGLEIVSFGINSAVASKEDEEMIKELQKTAVYGNAKMAAARLTDAQADAMVAAASNEGTGAFMAFAGLNMANQATGGGMNTQSLFEMANQQQGQQQTQQTAQSQGFMAVGQMPQDTAPSTQSGGWTCVCGAPNSGKFCTNCGTKAPAPKGWVCGCGTQNTGKFCTECGSPAKPLTYKCDKCGWVPEDNTKPPKFCPECGDIFDVNDR